MPVHVSDLRPVSIDHGVSRLLPLQDGHPVPLAPGHGAEVVRDGGGGRVFIVVLQPEAREAGWSQAEEDSFRATVHRTLDRDFRGHGPVTVDFGG